MFSLFKKKENGIKLYSVCDGGLKKIEEVQDEVFSQKMMGDGFAMTPTMGNIYSPVKGKVLSIFSTKHAITLVTDEGVEVLVHMGIDTVNLQGNGFDLLVEKGSKVDSTTKLAKMDLNYISDHGKDIDVIVVFTNLEDQQKLTIDRSGNTAHSDPIGRISLS